MTPDERFREAMSVLEELARKPGFNAGFFNCTYCHEGAQHKMEPDMFDAANHHASCPWKRAVKLVEAGK